MVSARVNDVHRSLRVLTVIVVAVVMFPIVWDRVGDNIMSGGRNVHAAYSSQEPATGSSDGEVDVTFNPGGAGAGPEGQDSVDAVAVQLDGKIVIGGNFLTYNDDPDASDDIMRLDANGLRDAGFNVGGSGASGNGSVSTLAVQPVDGKILIGGTFTSYNGDGTTPDGITRLNADGTRDATFNAGGTGSNGVVSAVKVQTDHKILYGGGFNAYNGVTVSARIMRLLENGTPDGGFNVGGTGIAATGGIGVAVVDAIALQTDGKILVGGNFDIYNGDASAPNYILRLNPDGSRDTTFNAGGLGASARVRAIAVQTDGKIIIGGDFLGYNGDLSLSDRILRLNNDGTPDITFNAGGIGANMPVLAIAIQADGRIVVGGQFISYNGDSGTPDRIIRLNAAGTLDNTFNSGGQGSDGTISALAIQPNAKILIAGTVSTYNGNAAVPDDILRLHSSNVAATPSPSPTPQITPTPTPSPSPSSGRTLFDFDGDHKADVSVFRPDVGEWYYQQSGNGFVTGFGFGSSSDRPVPADLTGDGKTDIAFFRPSTGDWYVLRSEDSTYYAFPFGASGDIPAPADFDADGEADPTVYRPAAQTWFIFQSSSGTVASVPFGLPNDVPVPADYDGDGLVDVGIYRPDVGQWWNLRSSNGSVFAASFGSPTDKPVPGDYTGDGAADVAFFRPSEGSWYVLRSEDQSFYAFPFGNSTDKPAPADFDGDGKFDATVFRPSDTNWYIARSSGGVTIQQFGLPNDVPLPGAFVP